MKPCKASGKRKWRTKLDCYIAHQHNPRKVYAYVCPHCGFVHVATKRMPRGWR